MKREDYLHHYLPHEAFLWTLLIIDGECLFIFLFIFLSLFFLHLVLNTLETLLPQQEELSGGEKWFDDTSLYQTSFLFAQSFITHSLYLPSIFFLLQSKDKRVEKIDVTLMNVSCVSISLLIFLKSLVHMKEKWGDVILYVSWSEYTSCVCYIPVVVEDMFYHLMKHNNRRRRRRGENDDRLWWLQINPPVKWIFFSFFYSFSLSVMILCSSSSSSAIIFSLHLLFFLGKKGKKRRNMKKGKLQSMENRAAKTNDSFLWKLALLFSSLLESGKKKKNWCSPLGSFCVSRR